MIVHELDTFSRDLSSNFTLKDCFFGGVKLTKNVDPEKYGSSGYDIGYDSRSEYSLVCKNVIIFGVDMSSPVHIDNKKKDILILGKVPTQGLDHTTLTAEPRYSTNFSKLKRKFCLSMHYNGINSFLFVNATKIYQFKGKDSEIKKNPLCLRNIP